MKATLLAGLCFVLMGVIVGLAAPKGSLTQPFEGLSRAAPAEPSRADGAAGAVTTPVGSVSDAPLEQASIAEVVPDSSAKEPQDIDPRCVVLTEAARQGYMSAGYATQEFASTAIVAKTDAAAAAKVDAVRDQYISAMDAARTQVAEASRAQCWSKFGLEPPNLTAFASSLPSAAVEILAR